MMSGSIYKKGLVVGIIILFIGVGVQPAFAGESITTTLDKKEDCIECQVSDGISPLRVKILLTKLKIITNGILSSKLGKIPEIKESCQKILEITNTILLQDNPIICEMLWNIFLAVAFAFFWVDGYVYHLEELGKILQAAFVYYFVEASIALMVVYVAVLGEMYECDWAFPGFTSEIFDIDNKQLLSYNFLTKNYFESYT